MLLNERLLEIRNYPGRATDLDIRLMAEMIEALSEAVKPFAAVADIFDFGGASRPTLDEDPITEWEDHRVGVRRVTVGDFRRARAALKDAAP